MNADQDAVFESFDAAGKHCVDLINAANPKQTARWFASGASAQFHFDGNNYCGIELDANHKSGFLYIRVRLTSHTEYLSASKAKAFQAHYAQVIALAEQLENYATSVGFDEASALEKAAKKG